jgi:phosphoglycolate phosphatase
MALGEAGIVCACVTNKNQGATDELLDKLDLSPYFSVILGGDTGLALKPDAAPLLAVCQRLDVMPLNAVMVGDSDNDLLAARAAGCRCVLLPYGYSVGKPVHTLGADAIVPTLLAAAQWIVARPLISAQHA